MAPKGFKRPAAGAAGGRPAKKPAMDPTPGKCSVVAEALLDAKSLPESCRSFLAKSVKDYLGVYAEERHAFQARVVEMVATALKDMEADLSEQITQAEKTVASADQEKETRTTTASTAEAKLGELEEKLKSAQEAHDADKAAEGAAKSSLDDASTALSTKEAEKTSLVDKKTKLDTAMKEKYETLVASGKVGREGMKALNGLVKVLKELDFEEELVASLFETLGKAPSTRGTYDGLVLKHVSTQSAKLVEDFGTEEKKIEQSLSEAAQAKEAATAAHNASVEKLKASVEKLEAAKKDKAEGKTALAAAAAAVKSFDSDMKAAAVSLEDAKTALNDFKEGPEKAFAELKDLAPAPEPVEEPEVEAAAVEEPPAAADAPMGEAPPAAGTA